MGPLEQVTRDLAADCSPSMSADGRKLAFVSERSGNPDIWMKDLESKQEKSLTESPADEITPTISPDGSLVAYSILGTEARRPDLMNSRLDIYVMPTKGGLLQKVCDGCRWSGVCGWSQDNQFLLKVDFRKGQFAISLINLATGKDSNYLQSSQLVLVSASLTHDGRWTTFNAADRQFSRLEVLIGPFHLDISSKESDWIRVVSDPHFNDKPHWSPDENRVYFVSDRDSYACLWSQSVEPETKQPVGQPQALYHIHQVRRSILNVGWALMNIAVAPDKIVFNLGEITGNIWMTQLPEN